MADLLGLETDRTVQKDAVISECTRYRYKLTRRWDGANPMLPVCMLNPSTADHEKDDPTIRELTHFATLWGMAACPSSTCLPSEPRRRR